MNRYQLSAEGVELIKRLEGHSNKPYKDVAGLWTIGVGHLMSPAEVATMKELSDAEVEALLRSDLRWFEAAVNNLGVRLYQHEYDALVSLAFNIGVNAFARSTVARKLRDGMYGEVPEAMKMWNKAGGKVVKGLVNRREAEAKVFSKGH